jgi:hypothetical protein
VARIGLRLAPIIAKTTVDYGPEGLEWFHAMASVLDLVHRSCTGEPVSRYMLDLAAEVARGTANVAISMAQLLGPTPAGHDAELAFAVAAYTADCARHSSKERSVHAAVQAVQAAVACPDYDASWHSNEIAALTTGGFGPLWANHTEPIWSSDAWAQLHSEEMLLPLFSSGMPVKPR